MQKSQTTIIAVVVAVLLVGGVGFWAYQNNKDDSSSQTETSQTENSSNQQASKNIVVLASETSNLSTLVAAVKAAELVDTLQGAGPYTVLAPTDDAFKALPEGTLDTLLKPENKGQLQSILTYHVVQGQVLANQLTNGQKVKTVNGQELTVEITDGKVYFVDAKGGKAVVEKADVNASNGVVHVIGGVLLPQ